MSSTQSSRARLQSVLTALWRRSSPLPSWYCWAC